MKGPGERLKYDLRRLWECPACHHRERLAGDVTACFCKCQLTQEPHKQIFMKLIQDSHPAVQAQALRPEPKA